MDEDAQDDEEGEDDGDEDGLDDTAPLLPIFSAAHLDAIPVFALTHAVATAGHFSLRYCVDLGAASVSPDLAVSGEAIEQEIRTII